MSPSSIEVGKTYRNKGKGTTLRTVLDIGQHLEAPWFSEGPRPDEVVVKYAQSGKESTLYISSFSSWCGSEVANG